MAKALGVVKNCRECPNRSYYSAGQYECDKVQRVIPGGFDIPNWCPLADWPDAPPTPGVALPDGSKR